MTNNLVLLIVESLALVSCISGIAVISPGGSWLSLGYLGAWFILGACCNVAGLISLCKTLTGIKGGIKDGG